MDAIVIALLAFTLGGLVGLIAGSRFAGEQLGRQLRAEIESGRLTREEAIRISELSAARRR